MLILEPIAFENHFSKFVNKFELNEQLNKVQSGLNKCHLSHLIKQLNTSLNFKGLMKSFPIFNEIMECIETDESAILGLKDHSYNTLGSALGRTLDLLLALYSIQQLLGQVSKFVIKTNDAVDDDEVIKGTIFLSTSHSFGYDEKFMVLS